MKTLLVIINFPDNSEEIIRYAAQMARDLRLEVHLINIQNADNYPLGTAGSTGVEMAQVQKNLEEMAENAKNTFKKNIHKIQAEITGVNFGYTTTLGETKFVLAEYIEKNKASMLLMEATREEGFLSAGPVSMGMIRDIQCPIWVIPNQAQYQPFKKIIYTTDFKEEDIDTLKKLIALTSVFKPKITGLHITDSSDFNEKVKTTGFQRMVQSKTAYDDLTIKSFIDSNKDDEAELINDYAMRIQADLVVVLKENKAFLERIFSSSKTKKIIKKAELPVLIFHEKD